MSTPPAAKKRKVAASTEDPQNKFGSSADPSNAGSSVGTQSKPSKGKRKTVLVVDTTEWPAHFVELFKIYKALNTVIAFISSRQHIATTFSVVRTSVERLLRRPLDLAHVAEIKAIIPDLIKFAYIPTSELRIHSDRTEFPSSGRRRRSPSPDMYEQIVEDGQVLVLEFVDKLRLTKDGLDGFIPISNLPTLGPDEVKKLIEKRNNQFAMAVEELIQACNSTPDGEDPVSLVKKASRVHIPLEDSQRLGEDSIIQIPDADMRPSFEEILTEVEEADDYKDQIGFKRVFDRKEAEYGTLDSPLSQDVLAAVELSLNVKTLYSHQSHAINALRAGKHVIVSTGTASGKSVIYQVPLLSFLNDDKSTTAMFIFPTKALAQDQKAALEHLLARCPGLEEIKVATYDGDTPTADRRAIRETASVIFTNFDMIHVAILPHEDGWRRFLKNMKLVVVDELHYYNGTLGRCVILLASELGAESSRSHVALVMRRLRRVCAAIGNRRMRFVSCSATIANPASHMTKIFGVDNVVAITSDGSPAGQKTFVIWNPPRLDPRDPNSRRASSLMEACDLFMCLVLQGVKTILFCKIRKTCELSMKTLRAKFATIGRTDLLEKVRAYRGGYSQQDRRDIEKEAFSGKLLGIVATNALELGINIGSLDAVIMLGFPFSVASLRQQSGRAGRRLQDSLAVLVAEGLPMDQHFVANPDEIFDKPMADLIVDLENEVILEGHLQCAADEMPIHPKNDQQFFGPAFKSVIEKRLVKDSEGWFVTNPKFMPRPSAHVALRGTREVTYVIMDVTDSEGHPDARPRGLEEIELGRALFELYEGGIFMHQGMTFLVREVSHDDRTAKVIKTDVNWTTTVRDFTDIDPVETQRIRAIRGSPHRAYYGRISVATHIFGFFKIRNNSILDVVDLDTPPYERDTVGMWIDVPAAALELFKKKGLNAAEAIHAAEHVVLNMSPLFAFASDGDVKTECKLAEREYQTKTTSRKRPARLTFYDGGGTSSGVTAKAFDHTSDILSQSLERLEACECQDGCPSCIEATACRGGNLVVSKVGAGVILRSILALEIDEAALGDDVDPELGAVMSETIIQAESIRAGSTIEVEGMEETDMQSVVI